MTHITGPQDMLKKATYALAAISARRPIPSVRTSLPAVSSEALAKAQVTSARVTAMPTEPNQQQWLAADAIDQQKRDQAGADAQRTRQHIDQQRIVLGEAHGLPQHRAVIEHHVDADQLLERGRPMPIHTIGRTLPVALLIRSDRRGR
jgi:hypothetical protein